MPEVGNHQCVFDLLVSHLSFFHPIQAGSNEKVESLTKSSRVIGFVSFHLPCLLLLLDIFCYQSRLTAVFVLLGCHSIF